MKSNSNRKALTGITCGVLLLASAVSGAERPRSAESGVGSAAHMSPKELEPLASRLTLEESIDMLGGIGFATHDVPRLGIPAFNMSDGPSGVRSPGPSTAYAAGIGLAATWDPELAQSVGQQIGRDARARGSQYQLGPGVNIYRSPLNGRNFEYFGEDPWLSSRIAVGYIQGVQEEKVSATVKHFAGNNSEFARHTSDSLIDERALREIYLPVFEAAVKEAHVGAVMSSYNLTNGEHMSANAYLEHKVLREQWKFDGVVMSDWGGTYDGVGATLAGQDLEMPTGRFVNRQSLLPAIKSGAISADSITEKVRNQLRLADRFGWVSMPPADLSVPRLNPDGAAVAYRGALEGAVLLKNSNSILPIDRTKVKTVAVIGPNAYPAASTAGGSGHVPAFEDISLLEGLSHKLGSAVRVTYAPGIPPAAIMNMLTRFSTGSDGKTAGVEVEVFADSAMHGEPESRRVETQFSTVIGGVTGNLNIFDWLPLDAAGKLVSDLIDAKPPTTFERWTGWYTPTRAGDHTLSVQASGHFKLLVDDRLAIDASRFSNALVQQIRQNLSPGPHKVVFEQAATSDFGRASWRVNIVHEGDYVQALAKEIAAQADIVVLAVGFDQQSEGEGADREFGLPPGQVELIHEIAAINPNTVVVVTSGGAVDVRPWIDEVPALLSVWYPGQEGGTALADLLTGEASPSGRLPISWDRVLEENPSYQSYHYNDPAKPDRIVYREGIFVGYRGYEKSGRKPEFPFGFGLSYSTFSYSHFAVRAAGSEGSKYVATFDVTNTGSRVAADVAQVYVGEPGSRIARPVRELKAFRRVELKPGETAHVSVPLDLRSFAYYDVKTAAWVADAASYRIDLGRSSEDIVASATLKLARRMTAAP